MSGLTKKSGVLAITVLIAVVTVTGCARFKRGIRNVFARKSPEETITEEELDALGISPELSARGMVFADTTRLQDVRFGYDRYDITPQARRVLDENAEWLKDHPRVKVQIEGHCDERGTVDYNLALGERRATAVRKYLAACGINPDRLFTISYGEEQPVDPGHNEAAYAKNRRVHFKIKAR